MLLLQTKVPAPLQKLLKRHNLTAISARQATPSTPLNALLATIHKKQEFTESRLLSQLPPDHLPYACAAQGVNLVILYRDRLPDWPCEIQHCSVGAWLDDNFYLLMGVNRIERSRNNSQKKFSDGCQESVVIREEEEQYRYGDVVTQDSMEYQEEESTIQQKISFPKEEESIRLNRFSENDDKPDNSWIPKFSVEMQLQMANQDSFQTQKYRQQDSEQSLVVVSIDDQVHPDSHYSATPAHNINVSNLSDIVAVTFKREPPSIQKQQVFSIQQNKINFKEESNFIKEKQLRKSMAAKQSIPVGEAKKGSTVDLNLHQRLSQLSEQSLVQQRPLVQQIHSPVTHTIQTSQTSQTSQAQSHVSQVSRTSQGSHTSQVTLTKVLPITRYSTKPLSRSSKHQTDMVERVLESTARMSQCQRILLSGATPQPPQAIICQSRTSNPNANAYANTSAKANANANTNSNANANLVTRVAPRRVECSPALRQTRRQRFREDSPTQHRESPKWPKQLRYQHSPSRYHNSYAHAYQCKKPQTYQSPKAKPYQCQKSYDQKPLTYEAYECPKPQTYESPKPQTYEIHKPQPYESPKPQTYEYPKTQPQQSNNRVTIVEKKWAAQNCKHPSFKAIFTKQIRQTQSSPLRARQKQNGTTSPSIEYYERSPARLRQQSRAHLERNRIPSTHHETSATFWQNSPSRNNGNRPSSPTPNSSRYHYQQKNYSTRLRENSMDGFQLINNYKQYRHVSRERSPTSKRRIM